MEKNYNPRPPKLPSSDQHGVLQVKGKGEEDGKWKAGEELEVRTTICCRASGRGVVRHWEEGPDLPSELVPKIFGQWREDGRWNLDLDSEERRRKRATALLDDCQAGRHSNAIKLFQKQSAKRLRESLTHV